MVMKASTSVWFHMILRGFIGFNMVSYGFIYGFIWFHMVYIYIIYLNIIPINHCYFWLSIVLSVVYHGSLLTKYVF